MPSLHELQLRFVEAIFSARSSGEGLSIRANGLDGGRRIRVYRNNVFVSLTEALKSCYPVVEQLVGEGFFASAAMRYLCSHPSTSGNLHEFGGDFPEFLEDYPPAKALVYLPDVARLEWLRQEVYHAAEAQEMDLAVLAAVPPARFDGLRFRLHPASRLLFSPYPVLRIWQINQPDFQGDEKVDLAEGSVRLLIIRRGHSIEMEPLGMGEYRLLSLLAEGHAIALATAQALSVQADFDLLVTLRHHIARRTVVGFSL